MAQEEVVLKTTIDLGEGAKSLRSLKDEFKEAQKELDGLAVGSEKYINTLKKLGNVKDEIGDLNAEINAFNPEGKVQAFGNVIGGLASGFQAATGAAALFGAESEDVQKALLKVQAVMAFTEGIKGVIALGDGFKVLSNIIKANPIMFIATVLLAVGAALYKLTQGVDENVEAQKRMNTALQEEIKLLERSEEIRKRSADATIALLEAQGASSDQIAATQMANLIAEEEAAKKLYHVKLQIFNLEKEKFDKLQGEEKDAAREKYDALFEETNKYYLAIGAIQDAQVLLDTQLRTKDTNEYNKKLKDDNEAYKKHLEQKKKDEQDAIEQQRIYWEKRAADEKALREKSLAESNATYTSYLQKDREASDAAFLAEVEKEEQLAAKKKKAHEDEQAAVQGTLSVAQASNDSLMALSDAYFAFKKGTLQKGSAAELKAAKQQFDINKGLSIASATIMGIQAAIAAYQSGASVPVIGVALGPAMAILAGVSAAANIAKIASTKFNPGGGGGGMPTITAPSSPNPPSINAPQNSTTELNQDGTLKEPNRNRELAPVKAYVVETEMTDKQKKIDTISRQATIG